MIYLLRHGETVWNAERRVQGHRDSPLTLKGIDQMQALAGLLGELIEDPSAYTIVASPLARTWQSAVIVAETLGLEPRAVRLEPRLKERHFGAWEGLTWSEIKESFADDLARRRADKWNFTVPGGESYAGVAARVGAWLSEQDNGARLIVAGHGLAGRVLRGLYAGLSQKEIMDLLEPQGSLFRLTGGVVQAFEIGPPLKGRA